MKLLVLCVVGLVGVDAQALLGPIRGPSAASRASNPCANSPCGPNTRCETTRAGIARCRCVTGYVPDGHTINGCKPQCISDFECPDEFQCVAQKCERACRPGSCGHSAECKARNHKPVCECPDGYTGNAAVGCERFIAPVRAAAPAIPYDPCYTEPCGENAECRANNDDVPVCSCPFGYEGNPLVRCTKAECIKSSDCSRHLACQKQKCIDPCDIPSICGTGAECEVRNHQPVCSCGKGMTGDPFQSCRPLQHCNPSPCGENTNCRVENDRAVCSCIDNYIGDPLRGCRAECIQDRDCPSDKTCRQNRCSNPCAYNACGENAYCNVRNNRVDCTCPEFFLGDARSRCYAECTAHEDCSPHQACFELKCIDPCVDACGTNAICKVVNHKPICSCPKDYTGHPFESCRPFTDADLCEPNPCGTKAVCTPGTDRRTNEKRPVCTCPDTFIGNPLLSCTPGECTRPSDCGDNETCYQYKCQNACVTATGSVCGEGAECNVRNHAPVCSCPRGYTGNALEACYPPTRG